MPFPASSSVTLPPPRRVRQRPRRAKAALGLALFVALAVAVLGYYNVGQTLTPDDEYYLRRYLPGVPAGGAHRLSYAQQVGLIYRVQAVLGARTTGWAGLPEGTPREPRQLYTERTGMCYDRARTLEKMCRYLGFQTRHLSLFTREPYVHSYTTVFFHHVPSHAISEVLTRRGWLMVDSNDLWVALDRTGEPVSMHRMQQAFLTGRPVSWRSPTPDGDDGFYNSRCIPVYGLYSRHGRFYPPYTSGIPDYHLRSLLYNFDSE